MNQPPSKNFIQQIKDNLPLIVITVGIIITWANFSNADVQASGRLSKLELTAESDRVTQTQMLTQLSQIQTDILWIRQTLKDNK
jgi:hypothetical protein